MRTLHQITRPILPASPGARSFGRREVRPQSSGMTCIVLFKHDENASQLYISDDGDATSAVWINRAPVYVEPKDRGRFLVVTMPERMLREKNLSTYSIFDWDRYLPEEKLLLKDAVECASRARKRLCGYRPQRSRCNGRDHFA